MLTFLLETAVFIQFFTDCQASYCLQYTYNSGTGDYDSYYTLCTYGCCGSSYYSYCCSYTPTSSYNNCWSIGEIFGAAIGGFIILIIVCIVKACTKSKSNGRVVYYTQQKPNLFVTNTGTQPYP